ncbi:DUF72 domain-containing protein [Luteibacter aegosomatis]|uniref:DUF72 domain-containing protein n=1 Tax=Luteibacter aegosomatis TaxID=2911537 RepID=UPI001FFA2749|nr:DUF72 domain-containing protein [Luteibacter aegosomatis]UPG84041.1 DUF72 domain-containing protein [Luteibacter aegosomatis]
MTRIEEKKLRPIRIGCAGWSLSSKVAALFEGQGSHLERYARVFDAVEINTSFYRPHQPKTYARWAASVPDAFRFAVKMPKTISHELRLRDADDALERFMEEAGALGDKLGCLLLQLPPSLTFDKASAETFFASLRRLTALRVVCEPRHATWFTEEATETLTKARIAAVLADPPPIAGAEPAGDPKTLYVRLHGSPEIYYSAYDEGFIETLATRALDARNAGVDVWCIFDNTARGAAVPNALALTEALKVSTNG